MTDRTKTSSVVDIVVSRQEWLTPKIGYFIVRFPWKALVKVWEYDLEHGVFSVAVEPVRVAEVFAVVASVNDLRDAVEVLNDAILMSLSIQDSPGGCVGADAVDDPRYSVLLEAEENQFRMLPGMVEAHREGICRGQLRLFPAHGYYELASFRDALQESVVAIVQLSVS